MSNLIRQVVNFLTPAAKTPVAPVATPILADAAALVPASDTNTLDAAVAGFTSNRVELFTIKVAGLDDAKNLAVWLTKGQDRMQPATAVRLVDCTSDHLKNIVLNKPDLSEDYLRVIESILEDRGETLPDTSDDLSN